jgi:hypothetical protein
MRLARHAGRMGEMRIVCKIMVENIKGRDYAEELGID